MTEIEESTGPPASPITQPGGDPTLVAEEVLGLARDAMRTHPRSQQTEIGPSEIGTPCSRKLAAKLANLPEINPTLSWPAHVGTVLHADRETQLGVNNQQWLEHNEQTRWVTEQTVDCGEIDGQRLTGHVDCYDKVTLGVIDWKFPSLTRVREMARKGIDPTYRTQLHTYARGFARTGRRVEWVGLLATPTSGTLEQSYFFHEPYDESIAVAAIDRASALARMIKAVGGEKVARLAAPTEDYCTYCEWFAAVPVDGRFSCPGVGAGTQPSSKPTGFC
jgi:hypothetical protein